jgi:hypothetical protein
MVKSVEYSQRGIMEKERYERLKRESISGWNAIPLFCVKFLMSDSFLGGP